MATLPVGWGDRKNQMSEKDIKLGGMAAGSFKSKNSYDHDAGFGGYKSSDQVREYYLNNPPTDVDSGENTGEGHGERGEGSLPDFWLDRQRQKESDAKQMGCFSSSNRDDGPTEQIGTDGTSDEASAELALVKVATFALENMTASLARTTQVKVPPQDRAAFAAAVKGAMDVIANLK